MSTFVFGSGFRGTEANEAGKPPEDQVPPPIYVLQWFGPPGPSDRIDSGTILASWYGSTIEELEAVVQSRRLINWVIIRVCHVVDATIRVVPHECRRPEDLSFDRESSGLRIPKVRGRGRNWHWWHCQQILCEQVTTLGELAEKGEPLLEDLDFPDESVEAVRMFLAAFGLTLRTSVVESAA